MGEQFYTSFVKFTFPMNFDQVSSTSYQLQSCHCQFISGFQCVSFCGNVVTKRLTGAAMKITPEKLVNSICLCVITINTEVRQFRQSLFASVACMLYGHLISLLHVKQPHDSFLTVLVITGVPSCGDQPYSVGLQKLTPQHLIAR